MVERKVDDSNAAWAAAVLSRLSERQGFVLPSGLSKSAIDDFERRRHVVLPGDLREFYLRADGFGRDVYGEGFFCIWPLDGVRSVAEEVASTDLVRSATIHGVLLRTQLERIIERVGLKPWPKQFQNLRASRATELANEYPGHVVAAWLGHSTAIASKHYWQVADADFERATTPNVPAGKKRRSNRTQRNASSRKLKNQPAM